MGEHGRTLTEVLAVLAIIGVMLASTMPSMTELIEHARATSTINALMGAIQFTRHSAVMLRSRVTLCPSADGVSCGRDWQLGAIAFVDRELAGRVDSSDRVLRRFGPFPEGSKIRWRSFGNRRYLQFTPRGYTRHQPGHLQYCPANANPRFARQVIVNWQGRARMAPDRNGDGIREDARRRPLKC